MKRFIVLLALLFLVPSVNNDVCRAQDAPYVVVGENVWLLDERGERIFLLPETYYAPIVGIDESYYSVSFNGVVGKVPKSSVSAIGYHAEAVGTSQILHVSEKYSAFTGLRIRSSPENSSDDADAFVPVGEAFSYLGSYPIGEEIWYYVSYGDKYGYVLSDFCDKKVEIRPFVPERKEEPTEETREVKQEAKDDSLLKILIISGVAVTFLVLFLVLFLPRKSKKTKYYYET